MTPAPVLYCPQRSAHMSIRPLPLHDVDLRGRDVLKEADFSRDELQYLIDLAAQLKAHKRQRTE